MRRTINVLLTKYLLNCVDMKVTKGLIKAYSRMGQKGAAAGVGMLEVAKMDPELRVLVADSIAIASLKWSMLALLNSVWSAQLPVWHLRVKEVYMRLLTPLF